jgi:hypothetical protein
MTTRYIETERDVTMLHRFIAVQKRPYTISISKGGKRSAAQNRLAHQWHKEAAEQLQDRSPDDVRAYCKLTFGVPILRTENEGFRAKYDEHVKGLPYETKLALMVEPFDFPVTRLMTVKQQTSYLDSVHKHFAEQGVILTDPDALRNAA